MAVPHFSVNIIARSAGQSVVMSAAYRHCAKMSFEREARVVDYSRKIGLAHEEIGLPADAPEWAKELLAQRSVAHASEAFWNKVEAVEKRSDAQLAKDITIALPVELSRDQNIALVRDFVETHITSRGMVADWVYHEPAPKHVGAKKAFGVEPGTDVQANPHIHLMMTLRPLSPEGFGAKKVAVLGTDGRPLRNDAGKIVYDLWSGNIDDFNELRDGWFACVNTHLARAGLDLQVDGRSFERQGVELEPSVHLGVGAAAIAAKQNEYETPIVLERLETQNELRLKNARRIVTKPAIVLAQVTREKSVFDERDLAKALARYIDDPDIFRGLLARLLTDPSVVRLDQERVDLSTGRRQPARYTTREMLKLEGEMAACASWLYGQRSHSVKTAVLQRIFGDHQRLSAEQKAAIEHVTGTARIAAIIGRAGAGKTTMMKVACQAWQASGYRVIGGAFAGKAADGLQKEAGILSRTLSSWELSWQQGRSLMDNRTVFVLDEAGMVSSRQMAYFVKMIVESGAKLVLVGDPDQLQPIEAGAAFRSIAERVGYAELQTIYRQTAPWMRSASLDLARGDVSKAVAAYEDHGAIVGLPLKAEAIKALIADWAREYDPAKSTLILAHLRRDVRALNMLARENLVARGIIAEGFAFRTTEGMRHFAAGDQIVFLRNEAVLGVKNGMLARIVEAGPGRLSVEVGEAGAKRRLIVEHQLYNDIDHGYATTIHKAQGATVDRVKILASLSLDRHLTYVAMTRHREDLKFYYGKRSFELNGGLNPVLSRRNTKETTLDYQHTSKDRDLLRFANLRGLNLVNVARTVIRDRINWTLGQRQRLVELAARLSAAGRTILYPQKPESRVSAQPKEATPMIKGIKTFPSSIDEVVDERLADDPVLKPLWLDVSQRFRQVYRKPECALEALHIERYLKDARAAEQAIETLARRPESFEQLRGRIGLLASMAERKERDHAVRQAMVLADALREYVKQRSLAQTRYVEVEETYRRKMAVDIPSLSVGALLALESARAESYRDAVGRATLPLKIDASTREEVDRFIAAVLLRFGERSLLSNAAREADSPAFAKLSADMNDTQKAALKRAWPALRAAQGLAASERILLASHSKNVRGVERKGLVIR